MRRSAINSSAYVFGGIFLTIFLIWEALNYWTTEQGLSMMMGIDPRNPLWWIRFFAVGMVAMDILHLSIFFYSRLNPDAVPEEISVFSWVAWFVVTFLDVFLSVYTFGYTFEQGVAMGTTRGPQVFSEFLKYGPLAISLGMWGMTIFSITMGRSFIAAALGIAPPPPRPMPQPQRPPNNGGGGGKFQGPQKPQGPHEPTYRPVGMKGAGGPPAQMVNKPQRGGTEVPEDLRSILDDYKGSLQ